MCAYGHGTLRSARTLVPAALLALACVAAPSAGAEPSRAPRVIWDGGDRIYVASPDSGTLLARMPVRVFYRGREIASGEVTRVFDGIVASVRLARGRLLPGTPPESLEVRVEAAAARVAGSLSVGLPSPARHTLAPACVAPRLELAALPRAYAYDAVSAQGARLLATDSASVAPAWPETLVVRWFGDRADEEIALERGELDFAVFWPGEPSARLRENTSGFVVARGERARGVLAAIGSPGDTALAGRIGADLAALDAELFGGDLEPWREAPAPGPPPLLDPLAVHYVVDAGVPGRVPIERFLNRRRAALPRPGERAIRLAYVDAPVAPRDSLETAWRAAGRRPLFTLRCAVLGAVERAAELRALGADALANLPACAPGAGRP